MQDNIDTIIACLLMYDKPEEMQKLKNFGDVQELLRVSARKEYKCK